MIITHAPQVGTTVSARRKTLQLTQTHVAAKLSLSQNRLSELESRPETITVGQLLNLLNILGLELQITERAKSGKPRPDAQTPRAG